MDWTQTADIAARLVAATAVLLGYLQYRRSVRTRRAEWLSSLHEKFFENGRYDEIRQLLDYADDPGFAALESAVREGRFSLMANELYRYLNFFELLASLRRLGQISDEEILTLFEYDLRMITRHRFIIDALAPQGFERLPELLRSTKLLPK